MSGGLEPGALVGGRYRLKRPLGEGAMGFVWEASHVYTHARFALKFLKGGKEEDRRRFQREVRAAAAIENPHVIAVHDFIELPDGMLVMVMDLLEGETLGTFLSREKMITLPLLVAIVLPILSALRAAHAVGIVHRDLKPDNIFLERVNDDVVVKVLDFGVAKLTAEEGLAARTQALTGTGSLVGTPYYMSPEQVVSEKDLDARADIWSLGVLIYECLAGVRPTEADNVGRVLKRILVADFEPIAKHCPDLPEDVSALVGRMLRSERDLRTSDLTDIETVLRKHGAADLASHVRVSSDTRPLDDAEVDAHADTILSGPEEEARRATGRGETVRAVSLRPEGHRRRGTIAAVLLLAAVGAVVLTMRALGTVTAPAPSSGGRVNLSEPTPSAVPVLTVSAPASPSASTTPAPSASTSLSATASGRSSSPPPSGAATRPRPSTGLAPVLWTPEMARGELAGRCSWARRRDGSEGTSPRSIEQRS